MGIFFIIIIFFIIFRVSLKPVIREYNDKEKKDLINLLENTFNLDYQNNLNNILYGGEGRVCYVAKINNKLVGCIMIGSNSENNSVICNLTVDKKYKKRGIATLLHNKCKSEAIRINSSGIISEIKSDNISSISFHKKLGYKKINDLNYYLELI